MKLSQPSKRILATGLASIISLGLASCSAIGGGSESGDSIQVSVGRQPFAAGNSPITQYMISEGLFEEAAAELGQDIAVDWRDYPNAPPQVEAMVSNRLDIGMWGNTPVVNAVATDQPVSVIAVGEGHLRFVLVTKKDSGISSIEDLRGKRVGVTIGADPHLALLQMLKGQFGTSVVEDLGISLVNMPSQASSAQVPDGVDATVAIYPAYLAEKETNDDVTSVVNTYGTTEEGYSGDLGEGEGISIPSAKDSMFAPEGFYAHRSFWVARNALIQEHPEVIQAFDMALQRAISDIADMSPEEIAKLSLEYWEVEASTGAEFVEDELLFQRGWAWATKGDAVVLMKLSKTLVEAGAIDSPLRWEDAVSAFQPAQKTTQLAYEAAGKVPAAKDFTTGSVDDTRGAPQWKLGEWTAP